MNRPMEINAAADSTPSWNALAVEEQLQAINPLNDKLSVAVTAINDSDSHASGEVKSRRSSTVDSAPSLCRDDAITDADPGSHPLTSPNDLVASLCIAPSTRLEDVLPGHAEIAQVTVAAVDWRPSSEAVESSLDIRPDIDGCFRDRHRRTIWLRGVNVCAKIPRSLRQIDPDTSMDHRQAFFQHRDASFIGVPVPLAEADQHFHRLKCWGLTLIRFGVPWEALEHAGPYVRLSSCYMCVYLETDGWMHRGIYDEDYIDYVVTMMESAQKHGFLVVIDPHQDCWSRFSGGSGAPGWTLEAAGFDVRYLEEAGACTLHRWSAQDESHTATKSRQKMLWPTNYTRLASLTMFTLFFGGNRFAPRLQYAGLPIQECLQRHYIQAYVHLARRLSHLPAVLGFEFMNEPHAGFIGLQDFHRFDYDKNLHLGPSPTAAESLCLAEGWPQKVHVYDRTLLWPTGRSHLVTLNPGRRSCWSKGRSCIWREHGVWEPAEKPTGVVARILRPDYFSTDPHTGAPVDFHRDHMLPFVKRFGDAIRAAGPDRSIPYLNFFGPIPNEDPAPLDSIRDGEELGIGRSFVYAPHWYDLSMAFTKSFSGWVSHNVQELSNGSRDIVSHTYFGSDGLRRNYRRQISKLANVGRKRISKPVPAATGPGSVHSVPVVVGEFGIPMDMNQHDAFRHNDYTRSNLALDAILRAMEHSRVNGFTLWNYYPQNTVLHGDDWNGEDFSIFSQTLFHCHASKFWAKRAKIWQPSEISPLTEWYLGGRCLDAIIRPYAAKLAGNLQHMAFSPESKIFSLRFVSASDVPDGGCSRQVLRYQTEIFVPHFHYFDVMAGSGRIHVQVSDGTYRYEAEQQTLFYWHDPTKTEHTVEIRLVRSGVPRSNIYPNAQDYGFRWARLSRGPALWLTTDVIVSGVVLLILTMLLVATSS